MLLTALFLGANEVMNDVLCPSSLNANQANLVTFDAALVTPGGSSNGASPFKFSSLDPPL